MHVGKMDIGRSIGAGRGQPAPTQAAWLHLFVKRSSERYATTKSYLV